MRKIIIISSSILVLILGLGALSYKFYFAQAGFNIPFLEKKPEQVLNLMMSETPKLSSFAYQNKADIKVDYEFKESSIKGSYLVKEETTGAVNKFNPGETRAEQIFKGSLDLGGMIFSLEMETKKIGKMSYLKMNVIPFLLKFFLGDSSEGKWYEINEDDWKELGEQGKSRASDMYGVTVKENKEKQEKLISDIKEYVKKNNLLEFKEKLKDEKINNRKNYHYKAALNNKTIEGLKEIFSKFADEEFAASGDEQSLKSIKETINQLDKLITKMDLELWIDKNKFYLTKINFDIDLDFEKIEIPQEFKASFDYNLKTNIKGEVSLSKINEDIKIAKPETTVPLKELMKKNMEDDVLILNYDSLNEDEEYFSGNDSERIADIKQIQTALELYYNDNNRYPAVIKAGEPLEMDGMAYMSIIPENPLPNGEICAFNFEYKYMADLDGGEYRLVYCLEEETGGISAGYHVATMAGIDDFSEIYDAEDSDGDNLSDYEEAFYNTNKNIADTDNDGYNDGEEVSGGYNPLGAGEISQ